MTPPSEIDIAMVKIFWSSLFFFGVVTKFNKGPNKDRLQDILLCFCMVTFPFLVENIIYKIWG